MANGEFSASYNPLFGSGCFHRRIRLVHSEGRVRAELEDSSHAFSLTLHYHGDVVQRVEAQTHRYPLSTCSGAVEPLKAFAGQSLGASLQALNKAVDARSNCTHLFDLNLLAMAHARRPYGTRVYDVILPDEVDKPVTLTVVCDGESVLEWQVKDWIIQAPRNLAGNTLYAGFTALWQAQCGADRELFEYGLIAQKGYLVSHARRYDHAATSGQQALAGPEMLGICYSYRSGTIEKARYSHDSYRDFSNCPEQLLTLFDQSP